MQDQMAAAIAKAAEMAAGGVAPTPPSTDAAQARYGFAAMEWAGRTQCPCMACKLLRKARDALADTIIAQVEAEDAGTDPQQG